MKKLVSFFEIPSVDFNRAVKFYEVILGIEIPAHDWGSEKMAFFPEIDGECSGSISWSEDFNPSKDGVLIHLSCEDINSTLSLIEKNGGKIHTPKTKIEAEGRGYFALFIDSEGNRLGLYSDK
ncbi:VOC family protein [Dysgonomonas sp. ZJ709]|uniref:VOC family protein n=1 Tax=Dysgonomonas sp. ZJ709 TaxID=2709797 RepID=UPI0013EE1C88|nr:VOC family protein [Dysgonomonas sp. ZJ709]